MVKKSAVLLMASLASALSQGCIQDPLSVSGGGSMEIHMRVTGGFAGADYQVLLDGASRSVIGEACVSLCDFEPGELIQSLTPEQVDYVWSLFDEANIHALAGEDFGVQCCDQFHYEIDYRDPDGQSHVKGSSEALPQALKVAAGTVQGMVSGTLPVIVNFNTDPTAWPQDAFQIQGAEISGNGLQVTLAYGGGCRSHDVRVVAWGGWMESSPVQVRLFISHEAFDDPCDAWITREFTFDLVPLKIAYQRSYGVGEPGKTTLMLALADPLLGNPLGARFLEYRF